VLFAYLCWSAAAFFDSGFYITERTYYKPFIMGSAAVVICALYWYLIPAYGFMGAAYSAAAGFLVFSILTYVVSQRMYPVNYPYGKAAFTIGSAVMLYFLVDTFLEKTSWLTFSMKAVMLASYPAVLVALGVIDREDVRSILNRAYSLLRQAKQVLENAA
jgi:O-antigen/teichoic acid export membrane protein